MSVTVLHRGQPGYPLDLEILDDPPEALWAEGDRALLDRPRVAIIGSREPSAYGERIAYEAARALASRGVVIVSGMARGLDTCAHEGALEVGGGTIAVLGTGIDVGYPRANRHLMETCRTRGLVITEFEPGERPLDWHFPKRNRVIAALSRYLLVVEGRSKGGTSNTAEWFLKVRGDGVFAVPGQLGDSLAESPNSLLKDGAEIYLHPNDILVELGLPLLPRPESEADNPGEVKRTRAELAGAEATLFDVINHRPTHVDELGLKSQLDPSCLLAALSSLELQGLITQLPGKHFSIAS